tara:strand:+ start:10054 stop:10260 length:207 start_codon:yes stop_codon:yes gene_type:complete
MKDVMRFLGMVYQMAAIIFFGTYIGYKWDFYAGRWQSPDTPWATLVLSLLFTSLALLIIIRQALKMNK